jgi:hypothetical protein
MPSFLRYLPASEVPRLPGFEFATLEAAEAHTFASSDASYMVRVGTPPGPYSYYIISAVTAGVATFVAMGGGGPTVPIWEPKAQPASPHASDNEFLTSVADFTDWDYGAYLTNTLVTAEKRYIIEGTGNGTTRLGGAVKVVPGSEFAFCTRVAIEQNISAGLVYGRDLAGSSAAGFVTLRASTGAITATTNTSYTANNAVATVSTRAMSWLRIRVNGNTWYADCSAHGDDWEQVYTSTFSASPAPLYFGLVGSIFTNGNTGRASFSCFRVASGAGSSDFYALRPGRLVGVGTSE